MQGEYRDPCRIHLKTSDGDWTYLIFYCWSDRTRDDFLCMAENPEYLDPWKCGHAKLNVGV